MADITPVNPTNPVTTPGADPAPTPDKPPSAAEMKRWTEALDRMRAEGYDLGAMKPEDYGKFEEGQLMKVYDQINKNKQRMKDAQNS